MGESEVFVIGAGIVGLLTALELTDRGVDVVVFEAATVASGASGGLGERGIRANGRHPLELPLMARAYARWADLGYRRTGQLHVTEREADMPALAEQARRQRQAGIASELLDVAGVHELEPEISAAVVGAVWCPQDGTADHTTTCHRVAGELRRRGVSIREHQPVRRMPAARRVIVTANGGAAALVGVETFEVFPQALVVDGPAVARHLIGHHHRRVILKTLAGGQTMLTGGWLGHAGTVIDDHVRANFEEAVALYPGLGDAEITAAAADRAEAVSADLLPIIDHDDRVAVATGWSGHGFALAPAVAELLAAWVTTGRWSPLLEPFRASRLRG